MKNKNLYTVWKNMRQRCLNKKGWRYKYYGGRGITICEKWNTYNGFLDDMEKTYKKGLTLDRIDNNGNYCKENCRWTTMKVQNNNKSWNRNIKFRGITKNLSQWASYLKIKRTTLGMRLDIYKWPLEKAFTKKVGRMS